ncbi:hypothetical protein PoB_001347000 [Plakobranchus ocellatus]|uniref:Uncharacterized protein n=1 Tax=Plakobranchus ocellatus TaxID=259542 RepID=A0AAV3YWX5_9GAST|nr:hypothetical protein PoB_001347000 [Plakobranchus ocellatus]
MLYIIKFTLQSEKTYLTYFFFHKKGYNSKTKNAKDLILVPKVAYCPCASFETFGFTLQRIVSSPEPKNRFDHVVFPLPVHKNGYNSKTKSATDLILVPKVAKCHRASFETLVFTLTHQVHPPEPKNRFDHVFFPLPVHKNGYNSKTKSARDLTFVPKVVQCRHAPFDTLVFTLTHQVHHPEPKNPLDLLFFNKKGYNSKTNKAKNVILVSKDASCHRASFETLQNALRHQVHRLEPKNRFCPLFSTKRAITRKLTELKTSFWSQSTRLVKTHLLRPFCSL